MPSWKRPHYWRSPGKLLSPQHRRAAVHHLIAVMNVSERFALRVIGQHHTTQRHRLRSQTPTGPDAALREWLRQWAHDHPRWVFRRAYHAARAEAGMSTTYACSDSSARRACGCRSVAAATPRLQHHHHHDRRRPTGCGWWTYAWLRAGSLVTYFPRAAFRWAEDTALRWVRSDATEAKV